MLLWVSAFIRKCPALQRNSISIDAAADIFAAYIPGLIPDKKIVSQLLPFMSGATSAVHLQACLGCPAGKGQHSSCCLFGLLVTVGVSTDSCQIHRRLAGKSWLSTHEIGVLFKPSFCNFHKLRV